MKRLLISALLALAPALACAWGQEGHSIVGELAQRQLSPKAREATEALLGYGVSLASVSNWADTVAHGARPDTLGWHYVDIPLSATDYRPERDCVYSQSGHPNIPDTCVIQSIERNTAALADSTASPAARTEALKFLVHLVGDVHQPLHTVAEDAGGNGVAVQFLIIPHVPNRTAPTNLHAVWDSGLFRAQYYSWGEHLDALLAPALAPADGCAGSTRAPICWALEAHAIAQKPGYYVSSGSILGEDYLKLVAADRDLQLRRAGARLAQLLNSVLGR